jgi:hypothetical protein
VWVERYFPFFAPTSPPAWKKIPEVSSVKSVSSVRSAQLFHCRKIAPGRLAGEEEIEKAAGLDYNGKIKAS